MSEEKSLHPERLLKQSSRIESSETAEGTDKKPLGAHDAVYSLLRTAELAAGLRRRRGKDAKRKLNQPGRRIRLKTDDSGSGKIETPARLKFQEDDKRNPRLKAPEHGQSGPHLLSEKSEKRLRFERLGRNMDRTNGSADAGKAVQYRSQQQRFKRLRFSQRNNPVRRDFPAEPTGIKPSTMAPEPEKRRLRFERPGGRPADGSTGISGQTRAQGQGQRLRFSLQSGERRQSAVTETPPSSGAKLRTEPEKRRLRFERPGGGSTGGCAGIPGQTRAQGQGQRLRFSPQSGGIRQSTVTETPPSPAVKLRMEPEKRRLHLKRPGRMQINEAGPAALYSDHLRLQASSIYNRLRFSGPHQLWQPRLAFDPSGKPRLRFSSAPGLRHDSRTVLQTVQPGLIPASYLSETHLRVMTLTQQAHASESAFRYYATYTVWEERRTPRLLDTGEGRKSRLKFENDRKLLGSGTPDQSTNNNSRLGKYDKRHDKAGFFASALRYETDRMLDEISRSTEDPAVEGANAERKVASAGSRYGLKYGKKWRGNHDQRVAQREVTRANKQYIRDAKEQIYQQQYGRPSRSSRWRQTMQGYGKQARKFTERKLGAKATAEIEKIIAIIAKKGAAVIRVVAAYVGAPLLGIILAFILLFLLAMLFVGGIQNSAVTVLTAYTAEDTEIEAASSYYSKLEAELDKEIKNVSTDWKWQYIDAFHYDLDDIGHDPFKLMAYLSVKYPGFTFDQVKTEMDYIFDHCYTLTYDEWSETRGEPPDTYTYYHLDVTLRAKPMEPLLLQELAKDTENDLVSWYDVLMETKGAHQGYANPFDIDWSDKVSSLYGYRVDPIGGKELQQHRGLDIAMPTGTPIKAGLTGTVRYVGYDAVMGNYIIIDTDEGDKTMKYGHCDEVQVSVGDQVAAGETVIGTVGNSGQSTGPHLHVEILENGEYINPIYSLNYKEKAS